MKRILKSLTAISLALLLVFGSAPMGIPAQLGLDLSRWLKIPFSLGASASGAVWDGSVSSGFASGDGSEATPYIIEEASQLAFLASSVNGGNSYEGKHFKLDRDLVLNSADVFAYDTEGNITGKAEGKTPKAWAAIGTASNRFKGNFDGGGHTVSGIYIDRGSSYQGLFGYSQGTIKNVGVVGSYIKGGFAVGGLAGSNNGTVSNCYNTGSVTGSLSNIGGVLGDNLDNGIVSNCYNAGSVTGESFVGGLLGANEGDGTVSDCYNTGNVTGSVFVGGLAGENDSSISWSYNTGSVSGNKNVGGLAGLNDDGTVIYSYNTGSVTGSDFVGGLAGANENSISWSYNTGSVTGNSVVGGAVGDNIGTVSKTYYLLGTAGGGIDGADIAGVAEVLTDEEMRLEASFVDWNFDTVWTMEGDSVYPYPELRAFYKFPVTSVTLTPKELSIAIPNSSQLTADVQPLEALNKSVTWSSSDTDVATVDTNGLVTAKFPGTASITVTTVEGGFTATCLVTVIQIDARDFTVTAIPDQTYTGSALTPAVEVKFNGTTLELGKDYTVTYADNTDVGEATVTITGIGNFTGTKTANFEITAASARDFTLTIIPAELTYTGKALTPTVDVVFNGKKLNLGSDYTLAFTDNINVGTAAVTVKGVGNFEGEKIKTFTINAANASGFAVTAIPDQTYTGSAFTPAVEVKFNGTTLELGKDYTVAFADNIKVGTATVTIMGIGNFEGEKTVSFEIIAVLPEKISLSEKALTLYFRDLVTLTAEIEPADTTNKNIIWTSSDEKVVTVDQRGNLTVVGRGTAIITATVEGSDISDTCTVTVKFTYWQWILKVLMTLFDLVRSLAKIF